MIKETNDVSEFNLRTLIGDLCKRDHKYCMPLKDRHMISFIIAIYSSFDTIRVCSDEFEKQKKNFPCFL